MPAGCGGGQRLLGRARVAKRVRLRGLPAVVGLGRVGLAGIRLAGIGLGRVELAGVELAGAECRLC